MNDNIKFILDKNMERFDFYIEKADNKASIILAFSVALLGGMLVQLNDIIGQAFKIVAIHFLIFIIIFLSISIIFSLLVVIPRIPNMSINSCMYFKSVKEYNLDAYKNKINSIDSSEDLFEELTSETHELARICFKKMVNIRIALISLSISIILIAILILFKLFIV